ncbi:MAG: hypothetical protein ACHP9U_03750 [Steroidobacterales bacterium]|jgi:hypothetical protein
MKASALIVAASLLASAAACADEATCSLIREANVKTGSEGAHLTMTGYAFAHDTPRIYGLGTQTCDYLRDEAVGGEAAAVYRERYQAPSGSTDATIWISKSSGRVLREEQDGDIPGKGKGHISYRWPAKG